MSADWYYHLEGAHQGPVTVEQLRELIAAGRVRPTDWVWKVGMPSMVLAESVSELFPTFAGATPADLPLERIPAGEPSLTLELTPGDDPQPSVFREPGPKPKPAPAQPEVHFESSVTYRFGLRELAGPLVAKLVLEADRLRLCFEKSEVSIPFDEIRGVLEPIKGDFPEAMKKSASTKKLGAQVGRLASGLLGSFIGGQAGEAVSKVGGAASHVAEESVQLGKPPRNRLTIRASIAGDNCALLIDVNGDSREDMTRAARTLYRQIERARARHARGADDEEIITDATIVEEDPAEEETERDEPIISVMETNRPTLVPVAVPVPARPYRLMRGGVIQGPFSLEELRVLLGQGQSQPGDLISVETWLPVSSLLALLHLAGPPGSADPWGPTEHRQTAAGNESIIPVDEEFRL